MILIFVPLQQPFHWCPVTLGYLILGAAALLKVGTQINLCRLACMPLLLFAKDNLIELRAFVCLWFLLRFCCWSALYGFLFCCTKLFFLFTSAQYTVLVYRLYISIYTYMQHVQHTTYVHLCIHTHKYIHISIYIIYFNFSRKNGQNLYI